MQNLWTHFRNEVSRLGVATRFLECKRQRGHDPLYLLCFSRCSRFVFEQSCLCLFKISTWEESRGGEEGGERNDKRVNHCFISCTEFANSCETCYASFFKFLVGELNWNRRRGGERGVKKRDVEVGRKSERRRVGESLYLRVLVKQESFSVHQQASELKSSQSAFPAVSSYRMKLWVVRIWEGGTEGVCMRLGSVSHFLDLHKSTQRKNKLSRKISLHNYRYCTPLVVLDSWDCIVLSLG